MSEKPYTKRVAKCCSKINRRLGFKKIKQSRADEVIQQECKKYGLEFDKIKLILGR